MNIPARCRNLWRGWIRPFLVAALFIVSFRSAVADWNDVPTGSMSPTIEPGDRIFVNKMAYDLRVPLTFLRVSEWAEPKRGEVVVLFSPEDDKRLVKRIVAEPGDRIALRQNRLTINGVTARYESIGTERGCQLWQESLLGSTREVRLSLEAPQLQDFGPYTVPDGQYFLLGDNRDRSKDSRFWGSVQREAIVGRATTIVASIDKDRWVPRWERFFRSIDEG